MRRWGIGLGLLLLVGCPEPHSGDGEPEGFAPDASPFESDALWDVSQETPGGVNPSPNAATPTITDPRFAVDVIYPGLVVSGGRWWYPSYRGHLLDDEADAPSASVLACAAMRAASEPITLRASIEVIGFTETLEEEVVLLPDETLVWCRSPYPNARRLREATEPQNIGVRFMLRDAAGEVRYVESPTIRVPPASDLIVGEGETWDPRWLSSLLQPGTPQILSLVRQARALTNLSGLDYAGYRHRLPAAALSVQESIDVYINTRGGGANLRLLEGELLRARVRALRAPNGGTPTDVFGGYLPYPAWETWYQRQFDATDDPPGFARLSDGAAVVFEATGSDRYLFGVRNASSVPIAVDLERDLTAYEDLEDYGRSLSQALQRAGMPEVSGEVILPLSGHLPIPSTAAAPEAVSRQPNPLFGVLRLATLLETLGLDPWLVGAGGRVYVGVGIPRETPLDHPDFVFTSGPFDRLPGVTGPMSWSEFQAAGADFEGQLGAPPEVDWVVDIRAARAAGVVPFPMP